MNAAEGGRDDEEIGEPLADRRLEARCTDRQRGDEGHRHANKKPG